ncbi:bt1 family protein, partial [Cystoisospora suis]
MACCYKRSAFRAKRLTAAALSPLNPLHLAHFVSRVLSNAGWKFFTLLIDINFVVRGIAMGLAEASWLPYLKALGYDAELFQRVAALADIPWGLKGLVAAASDIAPVGGYSKKNYAVAACLVGVVGASIPAFVPARLVSVHVWLAGAAILFLAFEYAVVELMCGGVCCAHMNRNPEIKADLISFSVICFISGVTLGHAIAGPISDKFGALVNYRIVLPLAGQVVVLLLFNFLCEEPVRPFRFMTEKIAQHRGVFTMSLVLAVVSIALAVFTIVRVEWLCVACSVASGFVICCFLFMTLPRRLAKFNLYQFLWSAAPLSIKGGLDYFFTATPECLRDGPHFDYTYYLTYTAVLNAVATLVAVWLFQTVLLNRSYVQVAWVTAILKAVASLFDFVIVTRLNVRAGISDAVVFFLGDAIVYQVVRTLSNMPGYMLTAKLCPKGLEVTALSIMDGITHLGYNIAAELGAAVMRLANITAGSGDGCNFENLPTLVLVFNLGVPLLLCP